MPRAKIEHKASARYPFKDGEALIRSVGEVVAIRIEEAARLLAMGREAGDSATMDAARDMRLKAVKQIDEWAGKAINRQIKGQKGSETTRLERLRGHGKTLKRDEALKKIEELFKTGKEPRAIPGILQIQGICSARYARSLMKGEAI